MSDTGPPRVFCSHTSADKPAVLAFAERLRRDGIDAWVDGWEIDGGDDFVARINDGLARCTAGLVFFSRNTPRSRWVSAEISALIYRAVHGLRVVPVLLDDEADLPPLLAHYLRRSVQEYEAIRDTLLDRRHRPPMGPLPERLWSELLVRLTEAGERVRVQVWQGGEAVADETRARPALLAPSYRWPSEQALTEVGRACGALLFPANASARVSTFLSDRRPGDRLDIVVEGTPGLSRLPFETARLPTPGLPLLIGLPGVTVLRRPLAPPARLTPALPGPLKILIAVAAPDEGKTASTVLDGERELARILKALPEHGAQARPLEVAGLKEITEALRQDSYHVLHLSGHGSAAGIELEDEDGNPRLATPEEIAAAVDRGNRPLPLVFLSCCDPVSGDDTAAGLAERLLVAGLSQVVAMQGNVSDAYSTELATAFYETLATVTDAEPADVLAHARRDLELARQVSAQRGAVASPEFAAATIFCWGTPQPVLAPGAPEAPLKARAGAPIGGPVPRLGVDDLVGRRAEVRETLRVLLDDPRSVRDVGRRAGVTLCGVGGVGKSTVAGRVMSRLVDRGWVTAVVAGPLDLSAICSAAAAALDELGGLAERLVEQLTSPAADTTRLSRLGRALRDHRLLLVLDNFEDNLVPGGDAFTEDAAGALVTDLLRSAGAGRVLVTSRYPVTPLAGLLHDVRINPLSRAQAGKLLLRLPALEDLSHTDTMAVLRITGGHPRLLELVDAVVRGNTVRLASMADRLERYADELDVDLAASRDSLTTSMNDALDICLRDIALTDLVAALTADERDVLLQVAVSTIPVRADAITEIIDRDVSDALKRVVRLTLVTPLGEDWYFVERWTAQGLKKNIDDLDTWQLRSRLAAENRMRSRDLDDNMEAARNLVEATDVERAADLASSIATFLQRDGQLMLLAGFAGEILSGVPLNSRAARSLAQLEADANAALGLTWAAEARWRDITAVVTRLAGAEPDRADYQRDLSISYERLGGRAVAAEHVDASAGHRLPGSGIDLNVRCHGPSSAAGMTAIPSRRRYASAPAVTTTASSRSDPRSAASQCRWRTSRSSTSTPSVTSMATMRWSARSTIRSTSRSPPFVRRCRTLASAAWA